MHRIEPASRAILPTPPDDIRESTVVSTEELQGLRDRHPNVLIAGPSAAIAAAISEIYPLLRPPVTSVRIDRHAVLHLTLAPGTVILRNIAALNRVEQERLRLVERAERPVGRQPALEGSTLLKLGQAHPGHCRPPRSLIPWLAVARLGHVV